MKYSIIFLIYLLTSVSLINGQGLSSCGFKKVKNLPPNPKRWYAGTDKLNGSTVEGDSTDDG